MRFKVPQFIEVEDKLFGPLTFKQFAYLVGGAGFSFIIWRLLPFFIAILVITPVAALSIALAFYKPNNKPFIDTLQSALRYGLGNKLYIWKKKEQSTQEKTQKKAKVQKPLMDVPKLSESKLKDLAWELDIHESIYTDETKPR